MSLTILVLFCIAYDEWWVPMRDAIWANGIVLLYDRIKVRIVWPLLRRQRNP